uniref:Xylulose kinase-1 n=1 Tax=Tanacetum cinerariifolium TaxID=118510 RepID=A0A6L2LRG0_TANCI|nr:xylulose kinase-1 [Tanacetum cinerariifolium]
MNIWKVIQNGNSLKRTGRDNDGGLIILLPTTTEEHLAVQRESKARTTLLQSIPDDHIVAITLKTKGGLEFFSFDDMYYTLKTLEVDIKGYNTFSLSQSAGPSHSAFKARRKIDFDKKESARFNKQKVRCYKRQQRGHFARECRSTGGNDKQRYSSFKIKEIGKKEEDSKALVTVDTLVDWTTHDSESDEVSAAKEFGMIAGCDSEDALKDGTTKLYNLITGANLEEANTAGDAGEFALMGVTFEVHNCPFGCSNKYNELTKMYDVLNKQNDEYFIQNQAYKNSLKTLEKQKRVLQRNQLTLKDKIRVMSIELENTSNLLKHSKRINADCETVKKDLQTKLNNLLVQTKKWSTSSKNLYRLIDSSMSVRTKVGLGFTNCISKNELGWDNSAFSVFTTTSKDVEGRPIFYRFAKTDRMKVVPPPLTGDYISLSDHTDLDESQMSYGTKPSISCDPKCVPNDVVSCNDSDKSSEVNTNDFASSDSSVKSSEHQLNDSASCASTSSVSTSVNEAENESNVGKPIKEPISVQDLPSFTYDSSDKTKHTSRTSCNKNGSFNKKAGHFRKYASSVSKPQPFPTGRPKGTPVPTDEPNATPVPTDEPKATPVPTGKPKGTPVPTGKPKVHPVPTGRLHRPFPVATDKGCSPSVPSGIDGKLLLSPRQVVLGNHIEKVYIGYPRTILDLIHLHTNDNVADLLTKAFDGPSFNHLVVNIGMLNP